MLLLEVLCSKGPSTVQTATHTPPGKAFRHLRTHRAELTCVISTGNMNYSSRHLSDRKWELIPLTSLMGRIKAYVLMSVCQDLNLVLLRADFPRREPADRLSSASHGAYIDPGRLGESVWRDDRELYGGVHLPARRPGPARPSPGDGTSTLLMNADTVLPLQRTHTHTQAWAQTHSKRKLN